MGAIRLIPVEGIGEIEKDADLATLFSTALPEFREGDILVVSSKAVSKAEGHVIREEDLIPSDFAGQLAALTGNSPAYCELVLRESAGILRTAKGVVICRTRHGFVMANAGVDASNTGGRNLLITLPPDPDRSAAVIGEGLWARCGKKIAVVIADTFGRAWRTGQVDMAVGVWGLSPLKDYRGQPDDDGRPLRKTLIAVADELAAAADLAAGKTGRIPAVLIRGFACPGDGTARQLLMEPAADLFP